MIFEAVDKASDIARDYLVAPTATASAPAIDVLPKPWPEVIMALLFVVTCLAVKGFHKHYQQHKQLRQQQEGTTMLAGDLRRGDTFVERSPEEWDELTERERKKVKRVRVLALGPACRQDHSRVHLTTDAGNWCIPHVASVTRVVVQDSRPAPKVHHAPAKSRVTVSTP